MAVSKVLTALVVNRDMRIYHSHSANDFTSDTDTNNLHSTEFKSRHVFEKEDALA